MPYNKEFMLEAIRVANENIENQGGPFGAVIVVNKISSSTYFCIIITFSTHENN